MKRIRLDWIFRMNKMCSFYGWEYIMRCFFLLFIHSLRFSIYCEDLNWKFAWQLSTIQCRLVEYHRIVMALRRGWQTFQKRMPSWKSTKTNDPIPLQQKPSLDPPACVRMRAVEMKWNETKSQKTIKWKLRFEIRKNNNSHNNLNHNRANGQNENTGFYQLTTTSY